MPTTYITHIGTANPPHRIVQSEAAQWMSRALQLNAERDRKLKAIYRASAIESRHTVLADYTHNSNFQFFPEDPQLEPFPGTAQRMEVYRQKALPLCIQAIADGIPEEELQSVTHLVVVSCTGFYAPGIDIELIEALNLPLSTQRSLISFMGCYAAFNGLKLADAYCKADPTAKVLLVCVELCTLHFQKIWSEDNLIANALFADGAAAALLQSQPTSKKNYSLERFFCQLVPQGKSDMAWNIGDTGFEMRLSAYVPTLLEEGIAAMVAGLLQGMELDSKDLKWLAIHPGGRKILESVERGLSLPKESNRAAYQILKHFGNMSSATVLFVLKELLSERGVEDHLQPVLSLAFGPGLTLESALMRLHITEA